MSQLIKPGFFSVNASADTKRRGFDIMNVEYLCSGQQADILFFGDSITDYWDLELYFNRNVLKINRGIGGDTTFFASKRFDADFMQLNIPRLVILLGTNDIMRIAPDLWWRAPGADPEVVVSELEYNYRNMLSKCKDKEVYLCSVLPLSLCKPYDRKEFDKCVVKVNDVLKTLCAEFDAEYIDYYSALEVNGELPDDYTSDGVHPNGKAYAIMANTLKEKVTIL